MRVTASPKPGQIDQSWYVLDLAQTDISLGRVATALARVLMGKHKPAYAEHVDIGDYVVVLNTAQATVTGNKRQGKVYNWHTGYPGGIKEATFDEMVARDPNKVLRLAVKRMLPKGPRGRAMLKKLKLFAANDHHHQAQKLVTFPFLSDK